MGKSNEKNMKPTVSIITINYNAKQDTLEFINSIASSAKKSSLSFEVVVVDNASEENQRFDTSEVAYHSVSVIHSKKNLGFAGGNNLGIAASKGDFIFIVNNDTMLDLTQLEKLVNLSLSNPKYGILCPIIRNMDGSVQFAGYTRINALTGRNQLIKELRSKEEIVNTSYPHGAAMLISRDTLNRVGVMKENYFLYYEELDWGEHVRKHGLSIGVAQHCEIYHKESVSVGRVSECKLYFVTRNRLLFVRKHFKLAQQIVFFLFFALIASPKNVLSFLLRGEYFHIKTYMEAVKWHLRNSTSSKVLGYKFDVLLRL